MPPGMHQPVFIIEILYTAIVFAMCLLIFARTKEIYSLTNHKGIKYFRLAFLFFGVAFIFRFLMNMLVFTNRIWHYTVPRDFMPIGMVIVTYASSMAILYLTYSTIYKKFKTKQAEYVLHIIALAALVLVFATNSAVFLLLSQLTLFIFAIIMSFINHKKGRLSGMYAIYILLFLFWIVNLFADISRFFKVSRLPLYLLSTGIFLIIVYKVIRKIK